MASRRRAGSSAPTSSAPFSAPASASVSGPLMQRMIPALFSTSARLPVVAPAASNSVSAMDAFSPAPFSTATSAPSAMNFFTVSGIAAQRVSSAASFSTAIFTKSAVFQDQKNDEGDDQHRQRAPLQQPGEARIVADMYGGVLSRRADQQRIFFGHETFLR